MTSVALLMGTALLGLFASAGCGSDDDRTIAPTARVASQTPAASTPTATPVNPIEQQCLDSGGTVTTGSCCASAGDFPNRCRLGACGCSPASSREALLCQCEEGRCFDGSACVTR